MSLFAELKRRNVIRVAMAYVVASWLLLQVADVILDALKLPEWALTLIVVLAVLGFAPVVIVAWVYEVTPEGVKRASQVDHSRSVTAETGKRLNLLTIVLLLGVVGFILIDNFALDNAPIAPAGGPSAPNNSVAVLPFVNLSGDENNEYFSDGLSETLLHMLAQIPELQVAARTSAFKFKGHNEDIRLIGEQLGVSNVLEGSVQRAGNEIRITAQLINAGNGFHLWSQTYDRTLEDVFKVQDDIANSVANALKVTLLGEPLNRAAGGSVGNYDDLLKARAAIARDTEASLESAIDTLQTVIKRDPGYAPAYASLADAYASQRHLGSTELPEAAVDLAIAAAKKAVALDPKLAAGHLALGQALAAKFEFREAAISLQEALRLEPGNVDALLNQSQIKAGRGLLRDAIDLAERAVVFDPLNHGTQATLASLYELAGRIDEARGLRNRLLAAEPDNPEAIISMGFLDYRLGRLDEAERLLQKALGRDPNNIGAIQGLFYLNMDLAQPRAAQDYLERGERISEARLSDERAVFCLIQGDLACLEQAVERMRSSRDRPFVADWVATWQLKTGDLQGALTTLEAKRVQARQADDRSDETDTLIRLLSVRNLLGHDGELQRLGAEVQERIEQEASQSTATVIGEQTMPIAMLGARLAAARTDPAAAGRGLREAFEQGFRNRVWIDSDVVFDTVRRAPEMQAVMADIAADNARMLALIQQRGGNPSP